MRQYKILIVEDEILIADNIRRFLRREGHTVSGIAISYEEATALFVQEEPDIVLLDIRLSGAKSGIDVAHFIQQQKEPKPFIFLTSQMDRKNIELAKATYPSGYLSKPIHKKNLYAAIEIAIYNHKEIQHDETDRISLIEGNRNHLVAIDDILFLESDHVYVKVHTRNQAPIIQRCSLKKLLDQLPTERFIQTHRSFVVNLQQIKKWDTENIYFNGTTVPISRSKRKKVFSLIQE